MLRSILLTFTAIVIASGCSSSEDGGTQGASSTTVTTGATEVGTGTGGATEPSTDPTTEATTADSTGAPTTGPGPGDTSTGEPETTIASEASSDPTAGTTTDGTTAGESSTGGALTASSILEPKSGSMATGTALFTDVGGGMVDLVITLANVEPPGTHALHIHEFPDCSAPDGTSTGNHWNPPPTMLGELGTVEIGPDGTGVFMKSDLWSIGTGADNDVVDHSIIIHLDPDGGTRIACGVITKD